MAQHDRESTWFRSNLAALIPRRFRNMRMRDLRFLGLVSVTALVIAFYLNSDLRLVDRTGSSWRTLNLDALRQRIETGDLEDREADWYHPATEEEARGLE